MLVKLIATGKTKSDFLPAGIAHYRSKLKHYLRFEYTEIPDVKIPKGMAEEKVRALEGVEILKHINSTSHVVLLDEGGKHFDSLGFADFLQKRFNSGGKELVFVIGGPYGFSPAVYARAQEKLSLSKMTFSHQMVRVIALEQLYRAMSILNNEPYHHS